MFTVWRFFIFFPVNPSPEFTCVNGIAGEKKVLSMIFGAQVLMELHGRASDLH
jgi:hypothetical protein